MLASPNIKKSSMQVNKITVDGLWRCLCPSFGAIANSRLRAIHEAHSFPSILHARVSTRPLPSLKVSARYLHGEARPAFRPSIQSEAHIKIARGATVLRQPFRRSKRSSITINELTISELHDLLRHLDAEDDAFKKITTIVDHLVDEREEKPSLLHYDALIRANADPNHGSAQTVARLLTEMKKTGIVPDSALYHSVLQALAIHPDFLLRRRVMQEMRERWCSFTDEGWHNLAVGLLREHQYEIALDTLQAMQKKHIQVKPWLYDIFIYVFCESDELDEALKIIRYREEHGDMDISPYIWHYALDAFSMNYHYEGTLYTWRKRVETGYINISDGMCINVLNTAARHSDPTLATDVSRVIADRASRLDVHHYEALVEAYAGSSDVKGALHILSIMKKADLEPSEATTRPIYAILQKWEHSPSYAWKLLESLRKDGKIVPIAAVNVVLEAYIFRGHVNDALRQFKTLKQICPTGPITATFNSILQGCSKEGGSKDAAMSLALEMVNNNVRPDALTYDRLILTCLNEDDYEDAFRYLQEMRARFSPGELRMGTWNALVKKCVGAGDGRAWDLLEEMNKQGINTERLKSWVDGAWKNSIGPGRV